MTEFARTYKPTGSPWGPVQNAEELAPGIWQVDTASHGGVKLSPERLAAMPEFMRETAMSRGGWFEEDCDWALPALAFPEAFPLRFQAALDCCNRWHPDIAYRFMEEAS